jgi:hypothetical protein
MKLGGSGNGPAGMKVMLGGNGNGPAGMKLGGSGNGPAGMKFTLGGNGNGPAGMALAVQAEATSTATRRTFMIFNVPERMIFLPWRRQSAYNYCRLRVTQTVHGIFPKSVN